LTRGFDLDTRDIFNLGRITREVIEQYRREKENKTSPYSSISLRSEIVTRFLCTTHMITPKEKEEIVCFEVDDMCKRKPKQSTLDYFAKYRIKPNFSVK
jgi:hypothetical protein